MPERRQSRKWRHPKSAGRPGPPEHAPGTCLLQLSLNYPTLPGLNKSMPECGAGGGCQPPALCPLNQLKAGTSARIKQLVASPEVSHRLRELGLCEEQEIRLVSRQINVICLVCNARLGLSPQVAQSILVEPLPTSGPQLVPA